MVTKHYVLTRFNTGVYDNPGADDWMAHRIWLFFEYTVPSMARQTCKDFEWVLQIDERTPSEIQQMIGKYGTLTTLEWSEWVKSVECDKLITTRLDNDDYVERNFIEVIQREAAKIDKPTVMDTFGRVYDVNTEQFYTSGRESVSSMFVTLIEFDDKRTVYRRPHYELQSDYQTLHIKEYGWVMVVHDRNLMNRVTTFDTNTPQTQYANE
jgi:DNA gyrase/topoisomerase IV subunit A